jgi:regulatory protein
MLEAEYKRLRRIAFHALSRRDHSIGELTEKLAKKTEHSDLVATIIQELIDNRFLEDARFKAALIEAKYRQGLGPNRIIAALKNKQLSCDAVNQSFSETEWQQAIETTWHKRFNEKPNDRKEYLQQTRYLHYRGFTLEQINRFLREREDAN